MFILRIDIKHDATAGTISLSQKAYLIRMLEHFEMSNCNPHHTSLLTSIHLMEEICLSTEEEKQYMANKPYKEALKSLMWAQVATHSDLLFAVRLLVRFQLNSGPLHWKALLYVLGYVKKMLKYKLVYSKYRVPVGHCVSAPCILLW